MSSEIRTRCMQMVQMCLSKNTSQIHLPKWETTKGLPAEEREMAIKGWTELIGVVEDSHLLSILEKDQDSSSEESEAPLFSSDSDDDPTYVPDSENKKTPAFLELIRRDKDLNPRPLQSKNIKIITNIVLKKGYSYHSVEKSTLDTSSSHLADVEETVSENVNDVCNPQNKQLITTKKKYACIRTPDYCFFCDSQVQNFARHIQRNHRGENEVQDILSLPPKSLKRKQAIACIRKKGNYIQNSVKFFKPVHKRQTDDSEENYLPCPFCLGSYSRKLLWKHKKVCPRNSNPQVAVSLSEGQNLVVPNVNMDITLKTKVFPRMLADKITLKVKKDSLICAFGSRYATTHREQHHVNVCSRKMRELAKVLIESQKIDSSIKNLFGLLQPQYFDLVVQSVKIIARYDGNKDMFESPTFAMNISRSLKDCCDIAVLHIIKRKYNYSNLSAAEAEGNIGIFRRLLDNMWKHEISHQAGNDLNTKSWNKVTLVPLAADLKLFRDYLITKGKQAAKDLQKTLKDYKAFILLMETIFCRLLVLNRKRVGELQRLKLSTYMLSEGNVTNYEEFTEAVSPTEKILLRNFKRVVTRGKRGRGVPVLFSQDVQEHMKLLLEARSKFVNKTNIFLFANPASEQQPIVGYKVIQKHAHLCGAKNPDALTSTKLRKHLATLTQVFNMSANDVEQLATFMGHTVNVHKQVYRLPDDVYQTAKIAKLLLLMEQGEAGKYKGKTLDEIDLNLDEDILSEFDHKGNGADENNASQILDQSPENVQVNYDATVNETGGKGAKKCKKRVLVPWTAEQKKVVTNYFMAHIERQRPPKRDECERLTEMYPELFVNKSWTKIKVFVQNIYTKKAKFDLDI